MTRAEPPQPPPPIRFSPFVLDQREGRLLRGIEPLPVRQRALDVLQYLALRPGRLVTKQELLAGVWSGVSVSEIVLAVCVSELRKVLGDPAKAPRIIETVHGRGYRFIAPVNVDEGSSADETGHPVGSSAHAPVVGRGEELGRLDHLLDRALAGQRQLVFVTGDPGIGKTTLVDEFLKRAAERGSFRIARGQCVEQRGPGEPFMPVLEGFGRLCRQSGDHFVQELREHAPSWLLQLPGLISAADREALHREHAGVTRARMLREMVVGIEALTTSTPMVVVLEDLHWSDPSTVELLVALAQQRERRALAGGGHLSAGGGGDRPAPAGRDAADSSTTPTRRASRWPSSRSPNRPSRSISWRASRGFRCRPASPAPCTSGTRGNPLFMAHVASRMSAAIRCANGSGAPTMDLSTVLGDIPGSLRRAVEKQLERLGPDEQRVLEAAAVAGVEFTAGEVAAALDEDVEAVDARCMALAQRQQLVRALGTCVWPDGAATGRYSFTHALYVEILEDRVAGERAAATPPAHRQSAGDRVRTGRTGDRREPGRPLRALGGFDARGPLSPAGRRARRAAQRVHRSDRAFPGRDAGARRDARSRHARARRAAAADRPRARHCPRSRASPRRRSVRPTRARSRCRNGSATSPSGSPWCRGSRPSMRFGATCGSASPLAHQLLQLGEQSGDRVRIMEGHHAMGCNRLRATDLAAARAHLEQAIALYDLEPRFDAHRLTGHDPKVCCLGHLACVVWLGGAPARARACAEAALGRGRELSHPPTLALALTTAAWLYLLERDPRRVEELASEALTVAGDYGLTFWIAIASVQRGWALAALGRGAEAAELLEGGMLGYGAMGAGTHEAAYRAACRAGLCSASAGSTTRCAS